MNWSGNFREGLAREIRENKTLAKITAYTVNPTANQQDSIVNQSAVTDLSWSVPCDSIESCRNNSIHLKIELQKIQHIEFYAIDCYQLNWNFMKSGMLSQHITLACSGLQVWRCRISRHSILAFSFHPAYAQNQNIIGKKYKKLISYFLFRSFFCWGGGGGSLSSGVCAYGIVYPVSAFLGFIGPVQNPSHWITLLWSACILLLIFAISTTHDDFPCFPCFKCWT